MRSLTAFALVAAFAVAACAKSSPSSPTTNNNTGNTNPTPVDLNARINELLGEINSSANAIGLGAAGGGAGELLPSGGGRLNLRLSASVSAPAGERAFDTTPADDASQCTLDSTAVMWSCPATKLPSGLTNKVSFQFLSATNVPQLHFDTLTTAAIRRIADLTGTISQPLQTDSGPVPAVQTTNNHQDIILSAISAGTHVQNGTGTLGQTIAVQGRDTAFITAPTTTAAITTGKTVPYPTGGSYTAVVHTIQGATSSTTTQVTTFNNAPTATLVITFAGGGKRTCTYNMTSTAAPTCTGP
jgi:hypothetical protein